MRAPENKDSMDTSTQKIEWHFDTLPRKTKKALDFLSGEEWIGKSGWYLAGGTALALQAGTRKSFDLDFFTTKKDFDEKKLLAHFLGNNDWHTDVEDRNTIYGKLFKAKISFIAYPFFVPKHKLIQYGSIGILSPHDIAVMKITAISQRGRKRDFFDLYWCAHHVEPLIKTVARLKTQYPFIAHDYHHILKALVYFEDAEHDPAPDIYFKANWNDVKRFFRKEVPKITKDLLHLK